MTEVTGTVDYVGTKWNGCVKVNGTLYSNAKDFKNPAKQGDFVTLKLEPWESKGKKGFNIVGVSFPETKKEEEGKPQAKAETKERDYDSENRGKVRHGMVCALAPLVATDTITVEKAKEVVNSLIEFVMKG